MNEPWINANEYKFKQYEIFKNTDEYSWWAEQWKIQGWCSDRETDFSAKVKKVA